MGRKQRGGGRGGPGRVAGGAAAFERLASVSRGWLHTCGRLSLRGEHFDGGADAAFAIAQRAGIPATNGDSPPSWRTNPSITSGEMNGYPYGNAYEIQRP